MKYMNRPRLIATESKWIDMLDMLKPVKRNKSNSTINFNSVFSNDTNTKNETQKNRPPLQNLLNRSRL